MPSAADFNDRGTAIALTSNYVVLVEEHLGAERVMTGAADSFTVLPPHKYIMNFTVDTVAGTSTLAAVRVYNTVKPGSLPLYFLPWQQNAATSLRIPVGHGPGIFMTSMLSGCTVQVYGPANNPSICHANAAQTYSSNYTQLSKVAAKMDDSQRHAYAEGFSNHITTAKINTMLPPAPGGAVCKTLRKSDYAGKLDHTNLVRFQRQFANKLAVNETVTSFQVLKSGMKPKTGAFVFGLRDAQNDWEFFYQAAVEVDMKVQDKFNGTPPRDLTMDSAVLGQTTRFFP